MWEAIIGILGSLASTMLNKYQNDASIERMNEYNSPKSQLARYSEAGLSPANVYSQGAGSGTQNLIGNYQTSLGSDIVSSVMGASQLRQQKQLQQHQLQLIDAQANNQNAEAALKLLEAEWLPEEKRVQIANVLADSLLKDSQKSNVEAQTVSETYKQSLMDAQTQEALTKAGVNRQTVNNMIAEEELIWKQLESVSYDLENLKPAQLRLIRAQARYFSKNADLAFQNARIAKGRADNFYNWFTAEVENLKAQAKQANSSAAYFDVLSDVQAKVKKQVQAQTDLTKEEKELLEATSGAKILGEWLDNLPFVSFFITR